MARITHDRAEPAAYESSRGGHFEERRLRLVAQTISAEKAGEVVELGAGTGRITARLAERFPLASFTAVEIDEHLVAYGQSTYRLDNLNWSRELPAVGSADVVFSIDVIHHFDDRPKMFDLVNDTLRPGGLWLAIEPNLWHPAMAVAQERMKRQGLGENHFVPWTSEPEFRRAGFVIHSRRYCHTWPAAFKTPPVWAKRLEAWAEGSSLARLINGSVVYLLRRSFRAPRSPGVRSTTPQSSCSPHSVLSLPDHRPARGSSPSRTARVQGQQPMEG